MSSHDPVDAAVRSGKITPARAPHYRRLMEADPVGALAVIESLAAVLPVGEVGVAALPSEPQAAMAGGSAYPREWLGDVRPPSGPIIEGDD